MRFHIYLTTLLSLLAVPALSAVSWNATPFNPASVPLAVRSPYLSAWLSQGAGTALNADWPRFWTGSIVGWAGYAKVDGVTYNWMGNPGVPGATKAVQESLQFTSTQSVFVMTAGPVDLTIIFLSPVEPTDLVSQSLPLSYYTISAASNDGKAHSVQVYADISAEWVSGDNGLLVNWATTTGDVLTHQVQLAAQSSFSEVNDRIHQGSAFHSTLNTAGATYQTGEDAVVRAQFINNGKLANTEDTAFRAVSDRWPVFAFAHDLGNVVTASDPVIYSVGHVRDPAVQYIILNGGIQTRSLYFWSRFANIVDAIETFLNDYADAYKRAQAFDAQVEADAKKISDDYTAVVALSIRQAFAAMEITVSKKGDGSIDTSDVMIFMKEISSDGNVNTVDVIYPTWPLFLYTNPDLGQYILRPLLGYQASGQYPNKFSVHDMGSHYPNATGHNEGKDEAMPVEESGNMIIMALSYTQRSNDLSLIKTFYNLLDQWTQFLITDSLIPANQLSTDDFAGTLANQTNLAIKGIIGIKAMAQIAQLTGDSTASSNYSAIADSYAKQLESLAKSPDGSHFTLSYGDGNSWGLTYNLYADKLLGTNVFPSSIYDMQTAWYGSLSNAFGVPLDTRHTYTKSDWQIWTAGLVTSTSVRDLLISGVRKYLANGKNTAPFGDLYQTLDGSQVQPGFRARPVVGGHLALLALQKAPAPGPAGPSPGGTPAPSGTAGENNGNNNGDNVTTSGLNPTTGNSAASMSGSRSAVVLSFILAVLCAADSMVGGR